MDRKITLPTSLLLAGCVLQRPVNSESLPPINMGENGLEINGLQIIETLEKMGVTTTKIININKSKSKITKRIQTTIVDNEGKESVEEFVEEIAHINGRCIESKKVNDDIQAVVKKMCDFEFSQLIDNHPVQCYFEQFSDKVAQYYTYMSAYDQKKMQAEHKGKSILTKCNGVYQLKEMDRFDASIIEMKIENNIPVALAILEKKRSHENYGESRMIQYEAFL